ncbi:AT-rich interactive domain-containing protein 1-like isoform X2 [Ananas comosus]|uniref:AT-rich interactive domain-containing protein 1-like isoform X2 n=1 Tax=Ananas comosus TaxID=4615 RepID=A0A6P5HA81_ANACO|nr:AT-rich interactive domain-containing protein 1-like isoform X2 [Ananas comosus]
MFSVRGSPDSEGSDRVAKSSLAHSGGGAGEEGKIGAKTTISSAVAGTHGAPTLRAPSPSRRRLREDPYTEAEHRTQMAGMYILDDHDSLLRSPHCDHEAEATTPVSLDPVPRPRPLGFPRLLSTSTSPPPPRPWQRRYLGQQGGSRFGRRVLDAAAVDEIHGETTAELTKGRGGEAASPSSSESRKRKRKRDLEEMVRWVRDVAANPCDESKVVKERKRQILVARRAMFVKVEELTDVEEFPNFSGKRQKASGWSLEEQHKKPPQVPLRRSQRIPKIVKIASTYLVKKKLGRGEQFQADILEWRGPPSEKDISGYKEDPNTLKWVGMRVWPVDGAVIETSVAETGKGRLDMCDCPFPRSMACVRCHIRTARNQLKSELGPAFSSLGFDKMGEEVSNLLTRNEQMRFNALERLNPSSLGKTFWGIVSKHFNSKSLTELVNYFFNVYLPRRMGNQSRLTPSEVESDDDDEEEDDVEEPQDDADMGKSVEASSSGSSRRSQKARRS